MTNLKTLKSLRMLAVYLISIFSLYILFGCDTPIDYDSHAVELPAGKGLFWLALTDGSRTILPAAPNLNDIAVYDLTFTPIGGGVRASVDRANATLTKTPIILEPGTYGLVVNAYKDQEKKQLILRGTLDSITIIAGANTPGTVILKPLLSGGTGTFRYDINLPEVFIANMTIIPGQEGGTAQETVTLPLPKAAGSRTLNSGQYTITIYLEKVNGEKLVWNELLYVYQNLESVFSFTFTDAHFVNPMYTVTFDSNGGNTSIGTQSVMHGEKVNSPVTPLRDGYSFVGWYIDRSGSGNKWDFDTAIIESFTLYAKWGATLRYETIPYDGSSNLARSAVGVASGKLIYAGYDDNFYYYVYLLGHVNLVPVAFRNAVIYNGVTPITIGFERSASNETSVTQAVSKGTENSVTRSYGVDWNVTAKVGFEGPKVIGAVIGTASVDLEASIGGSAGWEYGDTRSLINTWETTNKKMQEDKDTLSVNIGENNEPPGKYRYSLFYTADAYYVLVLDKSTRERIDDYTAMCVRPLSGAWGIDYEPDLGGSFAKTAPGELLGIPALNYATLPEPTEKVKQEKIPAKPQAEQPVASHESGTHSGPINVTLTSNTPGTVIWYTTNGGNPAKEPRTLYQNVIKLEKGTTTTIKAIAEADGYLPSTPLERTYTISLPNVYTVTYTNHLGIDDNSNLKNYRFDHYYADLDLDRLWDVGYRFVDISVSFYAVTTADGYAGVCIYSGAEEKGAFEKPVDGAWVSRSDFDLEGKGKYHTFSLSVTRTIKGGGSSDFNPFFTVRYWAKGSGWDGYTILSRTVTVTAH